MENNTNLNTEEAAVTAVAVPATAIETNAEVFETQQTQSTYDYAEQARIEWRKQAQKDMIFGALWCIGGTALTLAEIGFIFWGAILFGGIQFIKGVINYSKS